MTVCEADILMIAQQFAVGLTSIKFLERPSFLLLFFKKITALITLDSPSKSPQTEIHPKTNYKAARAQRKSGLICKTPNCFFQFFKRKVNGFGFQTQSVSPQIARFV